MCWLKPGPGGGGAVISVNSPQSLHSHFWPQSSERGYKSVKVCVQSPVGPPCLGTDEILP